MSLNLIFEYSFEKGAVNIKDYIIPTQSKNCFGNSVKVLGRLGYLRLMDILYDNLKEHWGLIT